MHEKTHLQCDKHKTKSKYEIKASGICLARHKSIILMIKSIYAYYTYFNKTEHSLFKLLTESSDGCPGNESELVTVVIYEWLTGRHGVSRRL